MNNINFKVENIKNLNIKKNIVTSYKNNKPNSYFEDDIWIFENRGNNKTQYNVNINFENLENTKFKNKELMKEIAYFLMYFERKTPVSTLMNLKSLKNFFKYISENLKLKQLSEIEPLHCEYYINYITKKNYSFSTAKRYLSPLRSVLYKNSQQLSWGFKEDPYQGKKINRILKRSKNIKEINQTQIIEDKDWKSIIQVASQYINDFENLKQYERLIHKEYIDEEKNYKIASFNKKYKKFSQWGFPYRNRTEHAKFLKNVSISAGILIQAFTGMRESELLALNENCVVIENKEDVNNKINKIKGYTFKYETNNLIEEKTGRLVDWLCPDIVIRAIECLKIMNSNANYKFNKEVQNNNVSNGIMTFQEGINLLFIENYSGEIKNPKLKRVTKYYNDFINEHGINLDFKLTSHCFRRTLARFFAKSILDLPVDILKEQFKHFSKEITYYYLKEDKNTDGDFINIIEEYKKNENKETYFKAIKNKLLHSIETADNIEELKVFIGDNKIEIVNDYMAKIDKEEIVSPLECLTCKGVILLPELHLNYWEEMLSLYEELLLHEPNSKWFLLERNQIQRVLDKLRNNKAYIVE